MKVSHLRIGTRLGLGFGLVLFIAVLASCFALWCLQTVAADTRQMMQEPLTKERLTEESYRITLAGLKRTLAMAKSSDTSLSDYFADDAKRSTARNSEVLQYLQTHISNAEEQALFDQIAPYRQRYIDARDLISKAKKEGRVHDAEQLLEAFIPVSEAYLKTQADFLAYQKHQIDLFSQGVDATAAKSIRLVGAMIILFIVCGTACAWWLTLSITRPINDAVSLARCVAGGDLTSVITVESTDETGQLMQALKEMNDGLQSIVTEVRDGADVIVTASTEIASGNLDLSSRTESQASALEQTASSMEELHSTMQHNLSHVKEANHLASSASDVAVKGGDMVAKVVDTMGSIRSSSQKIVDIIAVIDGIAFQTNILALNAAVEAARAGDQGRGFAVVATEVRNLAQRSASAAKEIKALITDSVDKVEEGGTLVVQAGETMKQIVDRVTHVNRIMSDIVRVTMEQSTGIDQVNQAITQMDATTQQNAALVEQAAAAAHSLNEQATVMSRAVGAFKLQNGSQVGHPMTRIAGMAETHLSLSYTGDD